MEKIPMVKCFILKRGSAPIQRQCRYIPYNEFELWKYYMRMQHKFLILDDVLSLFIYKEEYDKYMQLYEGFELDKVRELEIIFLYHHSQLIIPIKRYIEGKVFNKIKDIILSHYINNREGIIRKVQDRMGFWIRNNS
jgi:hypothetical protein